MNPTTESIELWQIKPSRWQPRMAFDEGALWELAQSIQEHGLINPVLVFQPNGDESYELVAGERRVRASVALALAGVFKTHPAQEWVARVATVGLDGLGAEEREGLFEVRATIQARIYPASDETASIRERGALARAHWGRALTLARGT